MACLPRSFVPSFERQPQCGSLSSSSSALTRTRTTTTIRQASECLCIQQSSSLCSASAGADAAGLVTCNAHTPRRKEMTNSERHGNQEARTDWHFLRHHNNQHQHHCQASPTHAAHMLIIFRRADSISRFVATGQFIKRNPAIGREFGSCGRAETLDENKNMNTNMNTNIPLGADPFTVGRTRDLLLHTGLERFSDFVCYNTPQ